jgi:hypothetical protein
LSRFQDRRAATLVRKTLAIDESVSPRFTLYVTLADSPASAVADTDAVADLGITGRARSTTGSERSVRAARRVDGARGMTSFCPDWTRALALK